jgi:uncharacterized repeat protein (TIGR03837 family)
MQWDIFCRVIDNYGDIGACWRLSADLASRGEIIRLWVDDATVLDWMAPGAIQGQWPGIQVLPWSSSTEPTLLRTLLPAQVWIEGFGCEIPTTFLQHFAAPVWINLEYLSAEPFVERVHGLLSPVLHGPAKGASKTFFYPGFNLRTGGLLREPTLTIRQTDFDAAAQRCWLQQWGIQATPDTLLVSLFCYEPENLDDVLRALCRYRRRCIVLATHGRATRALQNLPSPLPCEAVWLPTLTQTDYDHLLWACDINCVRGEDSLVRGLWAGKPLLWHIYPQDDGAHEDKLNAFLDTIQAPGSVRQLHHHWNGIATREPWDAQKLPPLTAWRRHMQSTSENLKSLPDLGSALLAFAQKKAKM